MIVEGLFEKILLAPANAGADTLYVVSGYATAPMVDRHLRKLLDAKIEINLKLIVGMTPTSGILQSNHDGFVHLMGVVYSGRFECSYLPQAAPPVHAKMYAWFRGDDPQAGYVGSANYTQRAFFRGQKEAMEASDPARIRDYYAELSRLSCFCTHDDADDMLGAEPDAHSAEAGSTSRPRETARVSLLTARGDDIHFRAGLNWGQRPHRSGNEAYIPVRVEHSDFFPVRGGYFTVHTDDKRTLMVARRQDGSKAIHSPENNSILGEYFRRRIGGKIGLNLSGQFVTKEHLLAYGRTHVDFTKIDDENFLMDFSVPNSAE